MKYYYTDALAAAWMEDKFGMKFVDDRGLNVTIYDPYTDGYFISGGVGNYTESPDKAYVSPDSLHILEPQMNDLVKAIINRRNCLSEGDDVYEYGIYGDWFNVGEKFLTMENVSIIQRNGVAFMMPEVEE